MTGADLKIWRERLGLKEVDAARALDVPAQTYRNWEDGRTKRVPRPVIRLTRYFEKFGALPDDESNSGNRGFR